MIKKQGLSNKVRIRTRISVQMERALRSLMFLEELFTRGRGQEVLGRRESGGGTWKQECKVFVGGINSNITKIHLEVGHTYYVVASKLKGAEEGEDHCINSNANGANKNAALIWVFPNRV